jgi:hypothetical protein
VVSRREVEQAGGSKVASNTRRNSRISRQLRQQPLLVAVDDTKFNCLFYLNWQIRCTGSKMAERSQFELEREARVKANKLKMQVKVTLS